MNSPAPRSCFVTQERRLSRLTSVTPFKAKISSAEQLRVHTMLVIGGRDMEAGAVSVRLSITPSGGSEDIFA